MKKAISSIHWVICALTLAAIIAEFFFAGLGVFHASSFAVHEATGEAITFASYILLLLSLMGMLGRTKILLSGLLVVLMLVQNALVHVPQPFVAALHPLNGIAIMAVAAILLRAKTKAGQN